MFRLCLSPGRGLPRSSPAEPVRCRLTTTRNDMLVRSTGIRKKSGGGKEGRVDILSAGLERRAAAMRRFVPCRTIVLVGLMGAGKTRIGRRIATRLRLPFTDSDRVIEAAAGETIEEIFAKRGEGVFRDGERRVILRLLGEPVHVLATGGGAFMDPSTRATIAARAVSVWLRADLDVLAARVARRSDRPLLKAGDPRAILADLIERRHPIYGEADVVVDSSDGSPEATATRVISALADCPRATTPPCPEARR
jgi:shikimate kinase